VNARARTLVSASRSPLDSLLRVACSCLAALVAFAVVALAPARALANPVLGFIEDFAGGSTSSWSGGTPFSNPGTGGYLGASDGYLLLENSAPASLGTRSFGPEYAGDWIAAGITQVRVWINDVGADDPLEMHLAIGNGSTNFWTYDVGFSPPLHQWGEYVVNLTGPTNWTQILGSGTFAQALQTVDRIHIRHDHAPFPMIPNPPDPIAADVGIDHLLLTNGLVGVDPIESRATHPIELAPPYPNPSRGPVSLALRAADGGAIRIEIMDVGGRVVRHAELVDAGSGPRTWLWDGLDDSGRRTAAGYYRVRATGASGGMSRPLVRVN
jgi:flagellar hook capping protein FlgD